MDISPLAEATSKETPEAPQFEEAGDNASSQSVDEEPSRGIWGENMSGEKDEGGIFQEPLPKL